MVLIAIPILIQVYFNSGLTYGLMRLAHVPYPVAAPGALIGASNFVELAVATARRFLAVDGVDGVDLSGPASTVSAAERVAVMRAVAERLHDRPEVGA